MSFNDENENTNYIHNIGKFTLIHPKVEQLYKKKVPSWAARKVLESPWISDKSKIKTIRYFDPEGADILQQGVTIAKSADKGLRKVKNLAEEYISSTQPLNEEAQQSYALHKLNTLGGKKYKRRTTKKRKQNKRRKTRRYKKN